MGMVAYNSLMTSRPKHRLATLGEAFCAALMTVVGHALVLVALAYRMDSNRVTAEQGQENTWVHPRFHGHLREGRSRP